MLNQNVTHINPTIQLYPSFDIETGSIYRFVFFFYCCFFRLEKEKQQFPKNSGGNALQRVLQTWVFPKIGGFPPQIIHWKTGISMIIHHPFWGKTPPIFGKTHPHWGGGCTQTSADPSYRKSETFLAGVVAVDQLLILGINSSHLWWGILIYNGNGIICK